MSVPLISRMDNAEVRKEWRDALDAYGKPIYESPSEKAFRIASEYNANSENARDEPVAVK